MKPDFDPLRLIMISEGQLNKLVLGGLKSSQDAHGQVPNIESARKRIMHQIRAWWVNDPSRPKFEMKYGQKLISTRQHFGYWNLIPSVVYLPKRKVGIVSAPHSITLHWLAWSVFLKAGKYKSCNAIPVPEEQRP